MKASAISLHQHLNRTSRLLTRFGLLFWTNTLLLIALAVSVVFDISQYPFGRYIGSLLTLAVIFFLPGQNLTALIERVTKQNFSLIEKLASIAAIAFVVPPFAVSCLGNQFANWLPIIPYALTALSWIAATRYAPFFWETSRHESIHIHLAPALTIATLSIGMFLFQLTSAYYALPDLDPYYWLQQFQQKFQEPVQISLTEHRPLFAALGYLFVEVAQIDAYAFFKYLIPFLFGTLLLPATLVANRARSLLEALFVYFLPLVSASFLLYSTSSLPQSIANLLIVAACYHMLYAALSKQLGFFFLGGYLLIGSVFYHELGLLLLLPWLSILVWAHHQTIISFIRREWLLTTLLAIIMLLLFDTISPYIGFVTNWNQKVIRAIIELQPNFAFPATYINIDGNAVGWGDAWGVLRYYAFYFGPLAGLAMLFLFWHTLRHRRAVSRTWFNMDRVEKITLAYFFLTTFLFLCLAELFPRFFNLSLLPERAMGFAACFLAFLLGYFLLRSTRAPFSLYAILLTAMLLNLGAALYINSIKQYLITANQINSAEWIRGSLPREKIIITGTHHNLLRFHAQVNMLINIDDPSFYSDIRVFEKVIRHIPSPDERYQQAYSELLSDTRQQISSLEKLNAHIDIQTIRSLLPELTQRIQSFLTTYPNEDTFMTPDQSPPLYIYYSKESAKNPYADRPYTKKNAPNNFSLIFDQFPDRFERVYSLPDNEVVIWRMIQ